MDAGVGHVFKNLLRVQLVAFCDFSEARGTEGTFGVNVDSLARNLSVDLAVDAERKAQLGFATSVFPEDLSKRLGLHTASQQVV